MNANNRLKPMCGSGYRVALLTMSFLLGGMTAYSQTTTNVIVTPSSPVFSSNNVSGVPLDAAPGYPSGSFASNGVAKTDMYFTPESLFGGREITVGQVASMSYWTKTGSTHAVDPRDWYLVIYTKRYAGQVGSSFYGTRIGSEAYFSENISDPQNDDLRLSLFCGSFLNVYNTFRKESPCLTPSPNSSSSAPNWPPNCPAWAIFAQGQSPESSAAAANQPVTALSPATPGTAPLCA